MSKIGYEEGYEDPECIRLHLAMQIGFRHLEASSSSMEGKEYSTKHVNHHCFANTPVREW